MPSPAANPFLDLPAGRRTCGGGVMLRPTESAQFSSMVESSPDPVLVRGCGSGCGLTHFLMAATSAWPCVGVAGGLQCTWAALRARLEAPDTAARIVPALLGRWLALAVRCGDLPSTDPEMVAMQCEREPSRMLDFSAPSPSARWILAESESARAVMARHSRLGAAGRPLLEAALAWGARRAAGSDAGWRLPGPADDEAVAVMASAARACGLPLLWTFDALDDLALRPQEASALWSMLAALHAAGGRIVVAAQDDIWRTCLEPPLPSAWRRRMAARSVSLAPMPPSVLCDLLDDRLATAGINLPGLAAHVVATAFPLGGLPQEALVEAASCWAARNARPIEPVAATTLDSGTPALRPEELTDALLAAGSALPFVEAVPLHLGKAGRAVVWQLPDQWIILSPGDGMDAAVRESLETQSATLRAAAPAGTSIQLTAVLTGPPSGSRWPQPWNTIQLEGEESARLLRIPAAPAGRARIALAAGLAPLWERLTRPGHLVA